jgi:hypothetical protein
MSYSELAMARGITTRSATRLTFREGWRRVAGNDGRARVAVPMSAIVPREPGSDVEHGGRHDGQQHGGAAFTVAIDALKQAHADHVTALDAIISAQGQLIATAETRASQAESRVADLERELDGWRSASLWRR